MNQAEKWSLSAAICVLICFFLSWVQVSYLVAIDSAGDHNMPESSDRALWLVPVIMLIVILLGLLQSWKRLRTLFALAGVIGGLMSAYLMHRERLYVEHSASLVAASVTGWLSSGLILSLALTASALVFYFKPSKSAS